MSESSRIPEFREEIGEGRQALSSALDASFRFLRILSVLLILLYLASGVFKVEQQQVAFVLRAGKPVEGREGRQFGPGMHWTWPRPFSEIVKIDATQVQTIETTTFLADPKPTALFAKEPSHREVPPSLHPVHNGYVLSGDLSIVHTRCAVRYTLADPWQAVFGVRDVAKVLRNELDHAVTRIAAGRKAGELLRSDIDAWRLELEDRLRLRCAALSLGVRIEGVDLYPSIPAQIEKETQAVTDAAHEAAQQVAEAHGHANRVQGEAAAEAARILSGARSWSTQWVAQTSADVSTFLALQERFEADPDGLEDILRQEALGRVLSHVEEKFILGANGQNATELRMNLPRERQVPARKGHP